MEDVPISGPAPSSSLEPRVPDRPTGGKRRPRRRPARPAPPPAAPPNEPPASSTGEFTVDIVV
jgi:hypothetical protein